MSGLALSGTRAITDPSAGLKTSNAFCERAEIHWPLMRLRLGFASQTATLRLGAGEEDNAEPLPLPSPLAVAAGFVERVFVVEDGVCRREIVFIIIGIALKEA